MTPEELIVRNTALVSLPEICFQVQELAESPIASANDIGAVIGTDPSLSARLLKLVNSAFYGMPGRIETVTRAVNIIGMRELRNLTFAACAADIFRGIPKQLVDMPNFWQHSSYTGLVAKQLARHCHVLHPERLLTTGLLHDIGRLLLYAAVPDEMRRCAELQAKSGREQCAIEDEILGFNHSEAGYALLRHWNLPPNLCAAVRYHHHPHDAHDAHLEAAILHVADVVAHTAQNLKRDRSSVYYDPYGALLDSDLNAEEIAIAALPEMDDDALQLTGVTAEALHEAIDASAAAFSQILDVVFPMAWENR
jgi:putative nucleotidyltransferase with HDIG domain